MNKTINHNPLSTTKPADRQQAFLFPDRLFYLGAEAILSISRHTISPCRQTYFILS